MNLVSIAIRMTIMIVIAGSTIGFCFFTIPLVLPFASDLVKLIFSFVPLMAMLGMFSMIWR